MSNVQMIFWDVQHGNATYIKTPNGRHIVIDLGLGDYSGKNQKFSPLAALRNRYDVQQLDHVIITHPHRDHIDDILNFDAFSPRTLTTPRHITDTEVMNGVSDTDRPKFEKYCELRNRYNGDIQAGGIDDMGVPQHYGGVRIQRFLTAHLPNANFNNHSILTTIEYAGCKVVIPGDNEYASLDALMARDDFQAAVQNANLLLAPHHGRESAYHSDFVSLVNPKLTVVSDGSICDTSANARYSQNSSGWNVYNRKTGAPTKRNCLTTNSDGEVYVEFGFLANGSGGSFFNVKID